MATKKRYGGFSYESKGQIYLLTRDKYPRLTLTVDLSRGVAIVTDIDSLDDCSARDIADVLTELESFIKTLQ